MIKMPPTESAYYPLKGGLDLVTPAIEIGSSKCFDAQNYEPLPVGGYRRINGFERYDGRASPTAASYWVMTIARTGTIAAGNTVTGATSAATGVVLGVFDTVLVLARVTGTFVAAESLLIAAAPVATAVSGATQNSAATPSDNADYKLLAANDQRQFILVVPGSGRIRGIWVYNDIRYVFRDNAGATAGDMYKATAAGWVKITFGKEIQFTGAVGEVVNGVTITGATSLATATVTRAMLRTGTWTAAGAGTLILASVVGTFQSGEALQVGGVTKVTSSSLCTNIARAPGGSMEFVNANFTGSTATERMYGVDGVNLAFEFDGTNYIPIRTGMAADTPTHIAFHRNILWLTFLGSLQRSSVADPYAWTAVTGAAEIGMGSAITGLLPQSGNASGAALAVFTKKNTAILYGSTASNFLLVPSVYDLGYAAFTIQAVSNNTYGLTARGIQSLVTTLNYGDFNFAAVSFLIQPLLDNKTGMETCSTTLKKKNQYRLYFNDGTGLVIGLTGEKISGILPLNYGTRVVRCMCTATLSTGAEVTYFGSDDGYVYQDNTGTSFDGDVIEAWIWTSFNNLGSPRMRKQYRRAVFEVNCDGYAEVNATYDLGYATPNVSPAAVQEDQALVGAGGYWGQFTWDQFTWDTGLISDAQISIDGTETNIAFLFYSNRAQDDSHSVQGVNLLFTPRRLVRSGS
jgi:hypothetical protein